MATRTRAVIKEQIKACEDSIDALQAQRKELLIDGLLLCDDEQRYEEKVEVISEKKEGKRVKREALIGRVYWKQTFHDEDTGNPITVERNQVVRIDGEWQ